MKKFQHTEQTIVEETLVDTLCDICGLSDQDWNNEESSYYYEDEVTIEHEFGKFFGNESGGWTKRLRIDVCPKCFTNKILPYLKSIATLPLEYTEIDF